jgi:hypothetical protein
MHSFQEEKSLILFAVKLLVLGIWLDMCEAAGCMSIHADTAWPKIVNKVAEDFKVRANFVAELRKGLSKDGHIIYRDGEKRGLGSKNQTTNLTRKQLLAITTYVNTQHSEGKSLTNKKIKNWLKREHQHVKVSNEDHGSLCAQVGFVISSGEAMEEVIPKVLPGYHSFA